MRLEPGGLFTGIPDFKVQTVSNDMVDESRMAEQWVISGTWTKPFPGGPLAARSLREKSFTVPGASLYEWENGKIKKYDAYYDQMPFLTQIGVIPPSPRK